MIWQQTWTLYDWNKASLCIHQEWHVWVTKISTAISLLSRRHAQNSSCFRAVNCNSINVDNLMGKVRYKHYQRCCIIRFTFKCRAFFGKRYNCQRHFQKSSRKQTLNDKLFFWDSSTEKKAVNVTKLNPNHKRYH